uniref:Uncharacterized protein n=1 Tax=Ditylenchus dipsaci TaxID=166011 RepID=A0A915EMS9_9BILA
MLSYVRIKGKSECLQSFEDVLIEPFLVDPAVAGIHFNNFSTTSSLTLPLRTFLATIEQLKKSGIAEAEILDPLIIKLSSSCMCSKLPSMCSKLRRLDVGYVYFRIKWVNFVTLLSCVIFHSLF